MKDFLRIIGALLQILLITFILTACFAGLYGLVHCSRPIYQNDRALLKSHAVAWGLRMTGWTFLVVIIMIVFSGELQPFVHLYTDSIVRLLLGFVMVMVVGFVSAFFTICD
jgi:hypothetical protein